MNFRFASHRHSPSRVTAELHGRLDTQTHSDADVRFDALVEENPAMTTLIIDLGGLEYISSSGLRSIFRVRKVVADRLGGRTLLVNMRPPVRKVFEIVKAVPIHEVFASEAELEAYLDTIQRRHLSDEDGLP